MEQLTFPKKVIRNGSSDGITLPPEVKQALKIKAGDIVEVTIKKLGDYFYLGYENCFGIVSSEYNYAGVKSEFSC